MNLDLKLIKAEKINAYLTLTAVILGIASLNLSEKQILKKEQNKERFPLRKNDLSILNNYTNLPNSPPEGATPGTISRGNLTPSQLSAWAGWLLVIAGIIGTTVAAIRFNEINEQIERGEPSSSLGAISLLNLGTNLGFVASILSALGAQQKVEEEDDTVVVTPI